MITALVGLASVAQLSATTFREVTTLQPEVAVSECDAIFQKEPYLRDPLPSPIRIFKVRYPSTDYFGKPVVLSGMVAVPTTGAPKGLVVYFHGTCSDNAKVPSRYNGTAQALEPHVAVLAFATAGYAVAAPDYIGLGDHAGVHPYPIGSVNCRSGIDMIAPARQQVRRVSKSLGSDLYVTGYSEGGGVAMWAARKLNSRNAPFNLTAAAPMSGPYDVTGVQMNSLISRQSNPMYVGARTYFAAYVGWSAATYFPGVQYEDLFAPSFATYVPKMMEANVSDDERTKKLATKAFQMGAVQSIGRILSADFNAAIRNKDMSNPTMRQMQKENCYDWTPTKPLYLTAIKTDYLVPHENMLQAVASMKKRGVDRSRLRHYRIDRPGLNHISGLGPCLEAVRMFFDGGWNHAPESQ